MSNIPIEFRNDRGKNEIIVYHYDTQKDNLMKQISRIVIDGTVNNKYFTLDITDSYFSGEDKIYEVNGFIVYVNHVFDEPKPYHYNTFKEYSHDVRNIFDDTPISKLIPKENNDYKNWLRNGSMKGEPIKPYQPITMKDIEKAIKQPQYMSETGTPMTESIGVTLDTSGISDEFIEAITSDGRILRRSDYGRDSEHTELYTEVSKHKKRKPRTKKPPTNYQIVIGERNDKGVMEYKEAFISLPNNIKNRKVGKLPKNKLPKVDDKDKFINKLKRKYNYKTRSYEPVKLDNERDDSYDIK